MDCPTLFKLKQNCDCQLYIRDISYDLYKEEPENPFEFRYSDTVTLDIVTWERSDGPRLVAIVYTTHDRGKLNEVLLNIGQDGLFKVTHIILPTVDWYLKENEQQYNDLKKYKNIYVSDGKRVYKNVNNELIEIDPVSLTVNIDTHKTTLVKSQENFFSTCYLWKCYINLCKQLINDIEKNKNYFGGRSLKKYYKLNDEQKDLIYKRDFVWITINVLNYLLEDCRLEEAEEILEDAESCKSFCYNPNDNLSSVPKGQPYRNGNSSGVVYSSGCGCGK